MTKKMDGGLEATAAKYGMDVPPEDGGPQTPGTYLPRAKAASERAQYPMGAQVVTGAKVAIELRGSPEFGSDFGAGAPDPNEVADILDVACGWSATAKQAQTYLRYARDQEAHSWSIAFAKGNLLQAGFAFLKASASGVADRYPMLGRFLQLTVTRTQRGNSKRTRTIATKKAQAAANEKAVASIEKGAATTTSAPIVTTSKPTLN